MNEVSLRELIDIEIRRLESQITSLTKAMCKSETEINKRLEGMSAFPTREQLQATQARIEDRLGVMENQIRHIERQRSYIAGIAAAIGAISAILISMLGLLMRYLLA